jgi:hypothetical protein
MGSAQHSDLLYNGCSVLYIEGRSMLRPHCADNLHHNPKACRRVCKKGTIQAVLLTWHVFNCASQFVLNHSCAAGLGTEPGPGTVHGPTPRLPAHFFPKTSYRLKWHPCSLSSNANIPDNEKNQSDIMGKVPTLFAPPAQDCILQLTSLHCGSWSLPMAPTWSRCEQQACSATTYLPDKLSTLC